MQPKTQTQTKAKTKAKAGGAVTAPRPVILQDLVVKAPRRDVWDVGTWRRALQSADRGRTALLYDLYDDMLIDPVLGDAVDKRIGAVLNSDLTFLDAKGREVEEVSALIDTEEFEELQKIILNAKLYGRSGVELGWSGDRLSVYEVAPKYIDLTGRKVLLDPANPEVGIPYEGNPSLVMLGRDRSYGIILRAIPFAIYKRGGFGDWSQWIELFGMPQRIGKYNTYDPASKRLLEEAMERAGSASYLVIPQDAEVELHESNSGNGISFSQFRQSCNEEMLIAMLGQTLTTISGERGARSLGEVHQEVEAAKNKADMRFLARSLNRHILPYLELAGLPVKGGRFAYPDDTEATTVDDLVKLSTIISIPKDYIYNKYGIPVPEDDDTDDGSGTTGSDEDDKEPEDKDKSDDESKDKSKEDGKSSEKNPEESDHVRPRPTLSDPSEDPAPTSQPGKPSFFAHALKSVQGLGRDLTSYISALTDTDEGAFSIDVSGLLSEAVRRVYGGDAEEALRLLFEANNRPMQHGLDVAFRAARPEDKEFIDEFRYNTSVFDAFKAHAERRDLISAMTDGKGRLRSFRQFERAVRPIIGDYNRRWLQTEYNTAVRASDCGRYYRDALRTKHLYPNLEYMLSLASHRRKEHEDWVGTVLPIDHPWWDDHLPPSAWNCKCTVRKTRKPVTPVPGGGKSEDALPGSLRNNPGKTASPYNLQEHPYLKGQGDPNCPECRRQGLVPPGRRLSDDNHDGREDELCPLHRLAQGVDHKQRAKEFLETAKRDIIGKVTFTHPKFRGIRAVVVRNSITENTRYGELQSLKIDILEHLSDYNLLNCDYRFEKNVKPDKKTNVWGYHIFTTQYKGDNEKWRGVFIELQFEDNRSEIKLHFIKKIENPNNPNRP
ncbi:MAG: DUF935 family protein [Bacteroidales bacterium]|nr:DUF935 family protein [Bacteroidales bacterium]